jgi:hypothetical protein
MIDPLDKPLLNFDSQLGAAFRRHSPEALIRVDLAAYRQYAVSDKLIAGPRHPRSLYLFP